MHDRICGLLATLLLLGLLVGLPLLIGVAVGAPWPAEWASWSEFTSGLNAGHVADTTLFKILSVPLWLAWLQILVSALVSLRAELSNVPMPHLHLVPSSVQIGMGHLVATALLLVGSLTARPVTAQPAGVGSDRPVAAATASSVTEPPTDVPDRTQFSAAMPEEPGATWTVSRNDTLWDIAETTLGNGERWNEIWELNRGRAQPNGRSLTDPAVLRPGWVLALPGDAVLPTPTTVEGTRATGELHVVEPGETLSGIAEETLGDPARFNELVATNRDEVQADGETLSDPNLIRPGWRLTIPSTPDVEAAPPEDGTERLQTPPSLPTVPDDGPAVTVPTRPGATMAPPTTTPDSSPASRTSPTTVPATSKEPSVGDDPAEREPAPAELGVDDSRLIPVLGTGGTVLAAGLAALVRLRRRRRRVQRRPGARIADTPENLQPAELSLLGVDSGPVDWLNLELRALAASVAARPGRPAPRPRLVQVSGERIEILLAEPMVRTPNRWRPLASGRLWELTEATPSADLLTLRDRPAPMPALATVGTPVGQLVLLDLESEGLVVVTGDAEAGRDLVRSMAFELAASPLADALTVVVSADQAVLDPPTERMMVVASIAEAVPVATDAHRMIRSALEAHRYPTTFAARTAPRTEWWAPVVVVLTEPPGPQDVEAFAALVSVASAGGEGVALLAPVTDVPAGATELRVSDSMVTIVDLDLTIPARAVTRSQADQLAAVVAAADASPVPSPPPREQSQGEEPPLAAADVYVDPPAEVTVEYLAGPVIAVSGGMKPLTPQQTALFAYLASRQSASRDEVCEAMWGEDQGSDRQLNDLVYRARRAIGPDHLLLGKDGRFRVGPMVTTDLTRFEARAEYARRVADPTAVIPTLRDALDLIGGPPFPIPTRARRSYEWIDREYLPSTWDQIIGDTAHLLARMAIDASDAPLARHAARAGLKASPNNDALTTDLMEAEILAGNLIAAESIYNFHEAALEDLGLEVSDQTGEVLELLRARVATTSSDDRTGSTSGKPGRCA